ncbi:ABC transporter permease [Bacillus sp. 2205SS5-2]|uniref:ABC transporter permease n=1 Tax=Bacillus sp. 2205SS5-2 TaxID=3109031 RepID=UPI003005DE16
MRQALKQPLFLIGFTIIFLFLVSSFMYTIIWDNEVRQEFFLRSDDGKIIDASPYGPTGSYIFGTNKEGRDLFGKVIIGAKYTILAAVAVAILRMVLSIPLGFLLGTLFRKQKRFINGFSDSFHFIPLTIVAVYLLRPILIMPMDGFENTLIERLGIEVFILAALSVPILATLIGNETAIVYQKEYVQCAKTIGAGNGRIIRKHIYPALREKLFVLFGQQMMQTLIIFAHLGVLKLFLGGTVVSYGLVSDPPRSLTNEWSGLIGDSIHWIQTAPWIPLAPILCFALVMLAVAMMIEGYVMATSGRSHYFGKAMKSTARDRNELTETEDRIDFEWLKKTS